MKVVYVAGRFRGPDSWSIENNIRQAETLALEVWRLGFAALCPHTNTRFFQGAAPDNVWLEGDLAMLAKCDALITVDNWQDSTGARAEVELAKQMNLPVFHSLRALDDWRRAEWMAFEREVANDTTDALRVMRDQVGELGAACDS